MTHIPQIKESLADIEHSIKNTVWPEYEKTIKAELLEKCQSISKEVDAMELELETDAKVCTTKIMEKATNFEEISYNRGRLVQIKKIIT